MNADIEKLARESIIRTTEENCHNTVEERVLEQALATAKVIAKAVEEATLKRVGEVTPPEKWNEVYKRAFELSKKYIVESLKQGKLE